MDEQFYRAKIWRDFVQSEADICARFDDGFPALIRTERYDYLAAWPEPKWLRAILRDTVKAIGMNPLWLPKDLRLRRSANNVFAFNYGAKEIDLSRFAEGAKFIVGSEILPPAQTAIWTH
jgi:beta-galactosidase